MDVDLCATGVSPVLKCLASTHFALATRQWHTNLKSALGNAFGVQNLWSPNALVEVVADRKR